MSILNNIKLAGASILGLGSAPIATPVTVGAVAVAAASVATPTPAEAQALIGPIGGSGSTGTSCTNPLGCNPPVIIDPPGTPTPPITSTADADAIAKAKAKADADAHAAATAVGSVVTSLTNNYKGVKQNPGDAAYATSVPCTGRLGGSIAEASASVLTRWQGCELTSSGTLMIAGSSSARSCAAEWARIKAGLNMIEAGNSKGKKAGISSQFVTLAEYCPPGEADTTSQYVPPAPSPGPADINPCASVIPPQGYSAVAVGGKCTLTKSLG